MFAEKSKTFTERNTSCGTCLKTTNLLFPMSTELRVEYIKFVEIVKEDSNIMICNMCQCQLKRSLRFKRQCLEAWKMLQEAQDRTSLNHQNLSLCLNLEISKIEMNSIENSKRTKSKNHSKSKMYQDSSQKNLKLNLENDDSTIIHHNDNTIKNEIIPLLSEDESMKTLENNSQSNLGESEVFNYCDDMELNNDDDDVPLLLLKEYKKDKEKNKQMDNENTDNTQIKVATKKPKRELKEGFSSRMVQETDEYIVIKLTKEQVLKEMEERSLTESYIQSPFKCEKCVKGFNFQDVLDKHMEKHSKENGTFQCDMCSQCCRSAVSLRGHIKSHTTRYRCKLCGEVRLSRQHLLEHHASHTSQFRQYACNTCSYTTSKRTVMQRHVRAHTIREPLACERCGKMFRTVESLRVHTARHDKTSRLQCVQCSLSFVYRSLLRRHEARAHQHNDYYCVECDQRFKSSESLRLHFKKAKKHRDSSSYKHACPECPSRFFTQSALSAHASAAHGSARALSCALCPRRYSGRDALRAHAWRKHQRDTSLSVV